MYVIFMHGPAASGKHTIASRLSAMTGLGLFHNHLAVDAAKALFEFGTPAFNNLRASVWLSAFTEAASIQQSFIFTFHPEASVAPKLIAQLVQCIHAVGGAVHFVELTCAHATILKRLGNASRQQFGKLSDANFYLSLEQQGAFQFPPLPAPLITINTDELTAEAAATRIFAALAEFVSTRSANELEAS